MWISTKQKLNFLLMRHLLTIFETVGLQLDLCLPLLVTQFCTNLKLSQLLLLVVPKLNLLLLLILLTMKNTFSNFFLNSFLSNPYLFLFIVTMNPLFKLSMTTRHLLNKFVTLIFVGLPFKIGK